MARAFNVPTHGSVKTELEAVTLHDDLPTHWAATIAAVLAALQVLVVNPVLQLPVGVP